MLTPAGGPLNGKLSKADKSSRITRVRQPRNLKLPVVYLLNCPDCSLGAVAVYILISIL